ncbi:hypothetical protein GCM10009570_01260 [Dietzia natronolimnaea]
MTIAATANTDIRPGVVRTSFQNRAARRRTGRRGLAAIFSEPDPPDVPAPDPAPGPEGDPEREPGPEPGRGPGPASLLLVRVGRPIWSLTSRFSPRRRRGSGGVCSRLVKWRGDVGQTGRGVRSSALSGADPVR